MMQGSKLSRVPHRAKVRRPSQREIQENQSSSNFNSSSIVSSNRRQNRRQSQVAPEINNLRRPIGRPSKKNNDNNPGGPFERQPNNNNNNNNNPVRPIGRQPNGNNDGDEKYKCFLSRGWLCLFGGIFCLILLIAIVAVVLGIVLPMTTNSSSNSNATSKMAHVNSKLSSVMICSSTDRGLIAFLNESIPSGWTSYSYNYTATKTIPTLLFGFETDDTDTYYLDDVSVVDNSIPSIELLINPSFENSTLNATDWIQLCETTCNSQIVSGSQCFESSGNCLMTSCPVDNSSIFFVGQSFMATIGNTYTISFMLNHVENSTTRIMSFYLDVI